MPSSVYDLDKIKKWGKSRNWCPYYVPDPQGHQPPGSTIVGHDNDGEDGLRKWCSVTLLYYFVLSASLFITLLPLV